MSSDPKVITVGIPADLDAFDELLEKHWVLDAWKCLGFQKNPSRLVFIGFLKGGGVQGEGVTGEP